MDYKAEREEGVGALAKTGKSRGSKACQEKTGPMVGFSFA
jgi:hypothetical protein